MATRNKKWWIIHCSAGVAAAILLAFGVTQCSGKKSEREEKESVKSEYVKASETINQASAKIDSLLNVNRGLGQDNRAKADTIRMQRDSIATLNDSIVVLNDSLGVVNEQLKDCRKCKKQPVRPTVPTKPSKPSRPVNPVTPAPVVKPDTVVVVVKPTENTPSGDVRVELNNQSGNNGNIVVASGVPANTEIKLGCGSVNNGNIVVGNNNNVVVNNIPDTVARFTQSRKVVIECTVNAKRRVYK